MNTNHFFLPPFLAMGFFLEGFLATLGFAALPLAGEATFAGEAALAGDAAFLAGLDLLTFLGAFALDGFLLFDFEADFRDFIKIFLPLIVLVV